MLQPLHLGTLTLIPKDPVLDEVQDTIAEVDGALDLIESIIRRGGKLGMHLVLGVQDKQVKTLGLEGKGQLRINFLIADVYRDRATGQRLARIESAGTKQTLPIPQLPDPEALIVAPGASELVPATTAPTPVPATPRNEQGGRSTAPIDALLAGLLQTPIDAGTTNESAPPRQPAGIQLHGEPARAAHTDAPNANAERAAAHVPAPGDTARSTEQNARSAVPVAEAAHSTTPAATSTDEVGQTMLRLIEIMSGMGGDPTRIGQLLARLRTLGPSYDELVRLTGALVLRSEGKTKQQSLETAFTCSKGAGAGWRRAVALYDAVAER